MIQLFEIKETSGGFESYNYVEAHTPTEAFAKANPNSNVVLEITPDRMYIGKGIGVVYEVRTYAQKEAK